MRYLVTGGLGFLGQAVTQVLLDQNNEVIVFDNLFRGKAKLEGTDRLKVVYGDIRDLDSFSDAVEEIDSIIHLAYINGTKHFYNMPDQVIEVGIKGMLNVLEVAKLKRVKEVVLFSTSEVYQQPQTIPTPEKVPLIIPDVLNSRYSYGGSKAACELMLVHIGGQFLENWKIVRPHNIYGKNMGDEHVIPNLISKIRKSNEKLEVQGNGEQTRSFCYIDDFKQGIKLIINDSTVNQIYNIGTPEEISINALASKIMGLMNKSLRIVNTPANSGETIRRVPDVEKILKMGYKPQFLLNDGLRMVIE
jgi:nucleoside-diphosphate-sugar epimerase